MRPYQESVREHGTSFDVTLWASPHTQVRRFEVFIDTIPLAGKRILDAGCSRGDLAAFLIKSNVSYDRYIGVDALCQVIDYAKKRNMPRCEFHCGDFVADPAVLSIGDPEVICISGALNTMTDKQAMGVLESAWATTSEALLFNFLSDRAGRGAPLQTGPARRLNTLKLLDWAMRQTWAVAFRQDYFRHGHDATILLQKS